MHSNTPAHIPTHHAYSMQAGYDPEYLKAVAAAAGIRTRDVHSTCSTSDRTLYKQCLAFALFNIHDAEVREVERAEHMTDLADRFYAYIKEPYEEEVKSRMKPLQGEDGKPGQFAELDALVDQVHAQAKDLRVEDCKEILDMDAQPERWQKYAVNNYKIIKRNIEQGRYTPPEGVPGRDIVSLTKFFSKRLLENDHYVDVSYSLLKNAFRTHEGVFAEILASDTPYSAINLLPPEQNEVRIFTGAMGSGKTSMLKGWFDGLDDNYRNSLVVMDSDFLKPGLAKTALQEGVLSRYTGAETHDESAGVLHSVCKRFGRLAGNRSSELPHIAMNHIAVNGDRLSQVLQTQGPIEVHHISVDPDLAWKEARRRSRKTGRRPHEANARKSVEWSAMNLLEIAALMDQYRKANPAGPRKNMIVYLYERTEGAEKPEQVGAIDYKNNSMLIYDMEACERILGRAKYVPAGPDQGKPVDEGEYWKNALDFLLSTGLQVYVLKRELGGIQPLATLTPKGELHCFEELEPDVLDAIKKGLCFPHSTPSAEVTPESFRTSAKVRPGGGASPPHGG